MWSREARWDLGCSLFMEEAAEKGVGSSEGLKRLRGTYECSQRCPGDGAQQKSCGDVKCQLPAA